MSFAEFDVTAIVIKCGALVLIYIIGFCLQIKIIKTVKEEKTLTWDINLIHSTVMLIHFTFAILLYIITNLIPNLNRYVGVWFCYCLLFLRCYGISEILSHSLFISIYKYIFIVHNGTVRSFGQDRIKNFLFRFCIIWHVLVSLTYTFRPNYRAFAALNGGCGSEQVSILNNVTISESVGNLRNRILFCGFPENDWSNTFEFLAYIVTRVYCFLQTIIVAFVLLNLLEIFFYVRIFQHMKR